MKKLIVLLTGILCISFASSAMAFTYTITADATGGDCTSIGTWDYASLTCTLTENVSTTGNAINIASDNITLDGSGYTVSGPGPRALYFKGINIDGRQGVTVSNLTVSNFFYSIYLQNSSYNTITNNFISYNTQGIFLRRSSTYNLITGNTAYHNGRYFYEGYGIDVQSPYNTIGDNYISDSFGGIFIGGTGTTLYNNSMVNNERNVWLGSPSIDTDIDTSNTVDGKPIYYVVGATDQVFDSSTNAGVFYCIYCDNVTIKDISVSYNGIGIYLWNTSNSTVQNVTAEHLYAGILLSGSSGNSILNSNISNNFVAISLGKSHNNLIRYNTFANSGFSFQLANDNTIINNNFINASAKLYSNTNTGNVFNLNAPAGGNYWSSYNEPGEGCYDANADGFCDQPYYYGYYPHDPVIDYLPWTKQDGWLTPDVIIGDTISDVQNLVNNGTLSGGEGTALSSTLNAAIQRFEAGNTTDACNTLNAFIRQVEAKVRAGTLTAEEGQALIDAATLDECQ